MTYRAEIDGLRAVAVLLVLAFHLSLPGVTGGFVGVDVFFVISGFLITGIILEQGQDFSLRRFYLRRARRLFPALFATVAATVLAAWFIFERADLVGMLRSALLALASLSNFGFWLEAGYWDVDSKLKPLLHTWSLGVEEQFYLLWPLLLMAGLALKLNRHAAFAGMAAIAVLGLLAAEWALDHHVAAAFYLMPFRITEFALGGLTAVGLRSYRFGLPVWARQFLFFAGLGAILSAALLFDPTTRFPGLSSWLPCLGTVAVILAARVPVTSAILTNGAARLIGKMSYSLYLVHWPLIVFMEYRFGPDLTPVQTAGVAAASFGLAYALYRWVETPLRATSKPTGQAKGVAGVIGAGWVTTLAVSLAAFSMLSAPQPVSHVTVQAGPNVPERAAWPAPEALLARTDVNDVRYGPVREVCPDIENVDCLSVSPDRINIAVLGDSLGVDGFNAVQAAVPDANVIPASFRGCAPVYDIEGYQDRAGIYTNPDLAAGCRDWNGRIFADGGILGQVDIVVVSTFWRPIRVEFFEDTLARMKALNPDVQILLLGNGTILNRRFVDIARDVPLDRGATIPDEEIYAMTFSLDDAVADFAARTDNVEWTSRNDFYCPGGQCAVYTPSGVDFVTYDRVHASLAASTEFGRAVLRPWLHRLAARAETG
ncbi:MAG: acyltransferase family protein [Litorimonas sp.]